MADLKTLLLDQLLANANDRSWYLSFSESIDGLTDAEAFWKPDDSSHSIAEIVQHLIYWNETWQMRYKDSHINAAQGINNDATFLVNEDKTFSALKERLLKSLLRWQEIITSEQLESKVKGFPVDANWWAIISNATTHNAYHIGQIVYIRKMQKSFTV